MAALLDKALKTAGVAQYAAVLAIKEFLIPFDTSGDADLMTRTVERLATSKSRQQAIAEVCDLADRVGLNARPSLRPIWLSGLKAGADNVGLPEGIVKVETNKDNETVDVRYSSTHLRLRDAADPLDYRDVKGPIHLGGGPLGNFAKQEHDGSFFDWDPLATEMAQRETEEKGLIELAGLFKNSRRFSRILTAISLRLSEPGKPHGSLGYREGSLGNGRRV